MTSKGTVRGEMVTMTTIVQVRPIYKYVGGHEDDIVLTPPCVQWLVLAAVVMTVAAQDSREKDRRPQRRRCYTCRYYLAPHAAGVTRQLRRSRGEKGDCRDPFVPPEVPEEERRRQTVNTAVAEVPCSTGWCSKVHSVQQLAQFSHRSAKAFLGHFLGGPTISFCQNLILFCQKDILSGGAKFSNSVLPSWCSMLLCHTVLPVLKLGKNC